MQETGIIGRNVAENMDQHEQFIDNLRDQIEKGGMPMLVILAAYFIFKTVFKKQFFNLDDA